MNDVILEVQHLEKKFGDNTVLRDINFEVSAGEVISIIGSSGSGKSTLLRCLNLLEEPTSGNILYRDQSILEGHFSPTKYRTKIGMVFQQFNLFKNMNALKNCTIGQTKILNRSQKEAEEIAKKLEAIVLDFDESEWILILILVPINFHEDNNNA